MAKQTLAQWVGEAMADPDKFDSQGGRADLTMISLVHMAGMTEQEVHSVKFGHSARTPEVLGELFQRKAANYCQDMAGMQTFCLLAFYGADPQAQAKRPFTINVEYDPGKNGLTTDSPTPQGQVAQQMRQGEMGFTQLYRQQNAANEIVLRAADLMARNVAVLTEENRRMFDIHRNYEIEKARNVQEYQKQLRKMERTTMLIEKGIQVLPQVVNHLSGKEVFPQAMADTGLIETLVDHLDQPTMEKIVEVFGNKPELAALLMPRLSEAMERKARNEEAIRAGRMLKTGTGDGEADASGDS